MRLLEEPSEEAGRTVLEFIQACVPSGQSGKRLYPTTQVEWTHFLKGTNYQSLLKKKVDNLKGLVSIKETKFTVKNLPTKYTMPYILH